MTHRAVDDVAGLPQGSTSAHFRTRASLLGAAAQRLADLDRESLESFIADTGADVIERPLPDLIADVVDAWTASAAAPRQLARLELQLEALRTPDLSALFSELRMGFHHGVEAVLQATTARSGAHADCALVAGALIALVDGLIYDRLLHPRTAMSPAHARKAVEDLLSSAAPLPKRT